MAPFETTTDLDIFSGSGIFPEFRRPTPGGSSGKYSGLIKINEPDNLINDIFSAVVVILP